MKKVFKAVRITLTVLLCIVLLINFCMLFEHFALHDDLPEIHGYTQAIVMSGSMEPVFSAGDMLIFKAQEQYNVQDIVIFRRGDNFVTHRIVDTAPTGFITRGDANNTDDTEILDPSLIEGKMIKVIPDAGKVLEFFKKPEGIVALIIATALLILGPGLAGDLKKAVRGG